MNMKLKCLLTALTATASLAAGSAQAATINMNILRTGAQSTVSNPGYGLWAQGTETWNVSASTSGTSLVDSTGAATTVGYSLVFTGGSNSNTGWGVDDLTQQGRYSPNDNTTISTATISGLSAGAAYELIFYHANNNRNETETANGIAPSDFTDSTTTTGGATYFDAFDGGTTRHFWYYASVLADSNGHIVVSASGSNFETATGFQVRPVPEPGSLALLGLGGLLIARRRR